MMARGHATMAALGGSIVGHTLLGFNALDNTIFTAAVAGFGLLPDLDEPKSTISRQFGGLSKPFSMFTRRIAGGHRNATHSWIFVAFGIGLGYLGYQLPMAAAILMAFSFLLGARTVLPDHARANLAPFLVGSIATGAVIGYGQIVDPNVILYAPALGILLHQMGDFITPQGIIWLYPFRWKMRWVWFTTDDSTEHNVMLPVLLLGLAGTMTAWTILPLIQWVQQDGLNQFIQGYVSYLM